MALLYHKIRENQIAPVRKFVRQGKLKSRIIPSIQDGKHAEIFLIKDNVGVLPEKPKGFLVKDENGMMYTEYEPADISGLLREG